MDKLGGLNGEVAPMCVQWPFSDDRDFLFHPIAQPNLTLFAHIMHHDTRKVLVRNTSDRPLRISRRQKLGHVVDIRYDNCFLANFESAFHSATVPLQTTPFFEHELFWAPTPIDPSMEITLDNGVRVYGNEHVVTLLSQLVAECSSIRESEGFVWIQSERWIKMPLKPGWEAKVSAIKPRVYPLGNEARQLVDKTFDKMHCFGRLKFTTGPPHSASLSSSFRSLMLRAKGKAEQWSTYKSSTTWFFPTLTPCPSSRRSSPTSKGVPILLVWMPLASSINGFFIQTTALCLLLSPIAAKKPSRFQSWVISTRWPTSSER